jgi:hypothetical protein
MKGCLAEYMVIQSEARRLSRTEYTMYDKGYLSQARSTRLVTGHLEMFICC